MAIVDKIMEITVAWTTEQGSRQLVWAALGGDPDRLRGGYVSIANVVEPSDYVVGQEGKKLQDRAWVSQLSTRHLFLLYSIHGVFDWLCVE